MSWFKRKIKRSYYDWDIGDCVDITEQKYLDNNLAKIRKDISILTKDVNLKFNLIRAIAGRKHVLVIDDYHIKVDGKLYESKKWVRDNDYEYIDTYGSMGELWVEKDKKKEKKDV